MIHSSTLGFSPHPPVSVYGTGPIALTGKLIFLQVWLPALSDRPKTLGTVGFQSPYVLQPPIPSGGGSVTPRSQLSLQCEYWNTRLTLIRLTLFRKPGVFGVNISIFIVVTYAYIFFSRRSSNPHESPSTLTGMLPYHAYRYASIASAAVLMPDNHPRLVSCYALFE